MGAAEIILIIIGAVILALSFALPSQKEKADVKTPQINEEQIKELVEKEIQNAKAHINDIVDETVSYSIEKTERAMERLTNEKMMAVKEYSDLVLDNINKNHNEVIFLYDMLNDKHKSLVSAIGEAAKTAKEISDTVQNAAEPVKESADPKELEAVSKEEEVPKAVQNKEEHPAADDEAGAEETAEEEKSSNSNEKILKLHKSGKPDTVIAKELGLGIGEVKLVIGLYK